MLDTRTTPPHLRLPALALVACVALYLSVCMALELVEGPGKAKTWVGARTFGQWNMFTLPARWNKQLKAQAYVQGEWVSVDLPEMYAARWESGPRYQRPAFLNPGGLAPLLAHSICTRMNPTPMGVRLYRVRWRRELGVPQTPSKTQVKQLVEWRCGQRIRQPGGTIL